MRRVDDEFITHLVKSGEDMSSKYAFSEFYDACDKKTHLPVPGIPIGLQLAIAFTNCHPPLEMLIKTIRLFNAL